MPRKNRYTPIGATQHIIQRGNNRDVCFKNDEDRQTYLNWLESYASKYQIHIHAYVLMTNHVHLLCTPHIEKGISKMMQSLGRNYVNYFNKRYERTGTLWEGRFRSEFVDSDEYFFQVYRYIEMNPVKAGMVKYPSEYEWSSYRTNALGKESSLITPHELYIAIGSTKQNRLNTYRSIFISAQKGSEST